MKSRRKPYSIRAKLILVTTTATAIALTVCAGSLAIYDRWSFSQQLNYELATEGKVLGSNCAAAIEFGDKANAAEVLGAVSASRRIDIVVIYDKNGVEFVRYTRPGAIQKFPANFTQYDILWAGKFTSTNPITYHGEELGTILLEGGEGDLAARARSYFLVAGIMMVVAVVVAILVAIRLEKRIFDPLAQLVAGMGGITQRKDYSVRIDGEGDDEVGLLVKSFNEMLSEIQQRDNELELRVEERTNALASEVTARKSLQDTQDALQAALKQANAANEAKSLFLAKMSHEIRTPMNGVLGMTEILLGTELDELQTQCAETIGLSGRNLLEIINDVLDFSKAEAGKLKLQLEPFDIEKLVGEVGAILAPSVANKSLELSCWSTPDVPKIVVGDSGRLRQILLNLVGNAVKFTEHGKVSIDVSTSRCSSTRAILQFEVRDTGMGISEDEQKLIFQSFMQVDGSRTRKQGGTGLGLTISKQLVELMGGHISVESEPGLGSKFSFAIELAVMAQSLPREELEKKKVLIISEDEDLCRHLLATFEFHHVAGVLAHDSATASQILENNGDIDFVISDLATPSRSNLEIAELVQAIEVHRPAVYLLTDSAHPIQAVRAGQLGISGVITKPFVASKLLNLMLQTAKIQIKPKVNDTRHDFGTTPPRILLVEDNEVNAMVASHFLREQGCTFRVAVNGMEAFEKVSSEPFDLVLMDVQLPVLDGLEATRMIRASTDPNIRNIVIIAMTANALSGERAVCIEAGMNDYLSKPFSQLDLSNTLRKWLDKEGV